MKKKKKNISRKKLILLVIPVVLLIVIVLFAIGINRNNDKNGVYSILEKRWIEKNKSTVIDVSVLNDLPIFGSNGEGVFFDFLEAFTKDTGLQFNLIPYKSTTEASSD